MCGIGTSSNAQSLTKKYSHGDADAIVVSNSHARNVEAVVLLRKLLVLVFLRSMTYIIESVIGNDTDSQGIL